MPCFDKLWVSIIIFQKKRQKFYFRMLRVWWMKAAEEELSHYICLDLIGHPRPLYSSLQMSELSLEATFQLIPEY